MGIAEIANSVIDFVRDHQAWAAPVVFLLAFGESLAFLSLMVPGWAALVGIGALMGASGINFWPVWIAGAMGAALGDWISYWIGYRFKDDVAADVAVVALSGSAAERREVRQPPGASRASSSAASSDRCAPSCRWPPASSKCRTGDFSSRTFSSALRLGGRRAGARHVRHEDADVARIFANHSQQ